MACFRAAQAIDRRQPAHSTRGGDRAGVKRPAEETRPLPLRDSANAAGGVTAASRRCSSVNLIRGTEPRKRRVRCSWSRRRPASRRRTRPAAGPAAPAASSGEIDGDEQARHRGRPQQVTGAVNLWKNVLIFDQACPPGGYKMCPRDRAPEPPCAAALLLARRSGRDRGAAGGLHAADPAHLPARPASPATARRRPAAGLQLVSARAAGQGRDQRRPAGAGQVRRQLPGPAAARRGRRGPHAAQGRRPAPTRRSPSSSAGSTRARCCPTSRRRAFVPGPGGLKRLTVAQYHNTLRDLFGRDGALPEPHLEPDTLVAGSATVGAARVGLSAARGREVRARRPSSWPGRRWPTPASAQRFVPCPCRRSASTRPAPAAFVRALRPAGLAPAAATPRRASRYLALARRVASAAAGLEAGWRR